MGSKTATKKNDKVRCEAVSYTHLIFSVGQAIDWGHMLDNLHVELRPNGGALANKLTYQTSEPDIFVGGDVYTGPKFAIDAIAAGREGAVSLHRYVHEHCTLTIGRNRRDFIELDKENIKVETYDSSSRQIPPKADIKEQAKTFRDLSQSLTEEQVKKETSRCLSCGASVVDPNKCIGCGVDVYKRQQYAGRTGGGCKSECSAETGEAFVRTAGKVLQHWTEPNLRTCGKVSKAIPTSDEVSKQWMGTGRKVS